MPRPRRDKKPARQPQRRNLTAQFVRNVEPAEERVLYYDTLQAGLALAVEPTGYRSYKFLYSMGGRPRWYTLGNARGLGLKEAREIARQRSMPKL